MHRIFGELRQRQLIMEKINNPIYTPTHTQLSLERSSKFLSQLDDEKMKRLELMLYEIRSEINTTNQCFLSMDGSNVLPLCVAPYYEDNESGITEEFAHKAPVLLDCFFTNYKFEWDLTTMRVSKAQLTGLLIGSC